ncbi:MAG TPA: hypothetical protein VKA84_20690 [Gemmatimonadaceae bacterium]|nr:hypothetical protein [Gemmatimonadaceae bacterium]
MRRASAVVRLLVVLLALVQAAAPAAVSLADARLVATNPVLSGEAHIEDHGSSSCPRVHPLDCALCQYVSAPFLSSAPDAGPFALERAVALPHGPAEHRRAAAALRQPPSRAPPGSLTA